MRHILDDIFYEFLEEIKNNSKNITRMIPSRMEMKTNIETLNDKFILNIELPGFLKDEITVKVKDDILYVSAQRKNMENNEDVKYIKQERYNDYCFREYFLENVDYSKMEAKYSNGLLTLSIPKIEKPENIITVDIKD